jgi:hypothetical protein
MVQQTFDYLIILTKCFKLFSKLKFRMWQLLQELDNHFNDTSPQLLVCQDIFKSRNSFQDFNVENITNLTKLCPNFNSGKLRDISHQLYLM